jgi:hypothetical protein
MYIDGCLKPAGAAAAGTTATAAAPTIGMPLAAGGITLGMRVFDGLNDYFTGYIFEALVFSNLPDADRATLEIQLMNKWGQSARLACGVPAGSATCPAGSLRDANGNCNLCPAGSFCTASAVAPTPCTCAAGTSCPAGWSVNVGETTSRTTEVGPPTHARARTRAHTDMHKRPSARESVLLQAHKQTSTRTY